MGLLIKRNIRFFLNGIFLGYFREERYIGRLLIFLKRLRNDERGNISFLEIIVNFLGG